MSRSAGGALRDTDYTTSIAANDRPSQSRPARGIRKISPLTDNVVPPEGDEDRCAGCRPAPLHRWRNLLRHRDPPGQARQWQTRREGSCAIPHPGGLRPGPGLPRSAIRIWKPAWWATRIRSPRMSRPSWPWGFDAGSKISSPSGWSPRPFVAWAETMKVRWKSGTTPKCRLWNRAMGVRSFGRMPRPSSCLELLRQRVGFALSQIFIHLPPHGRHWRRSPRSMATSLRHCCRTMRSATTATRSSSVSRILAWACT